MAKLKRRGALRTRKSKRGFSSDVYMQIGDDQLIALSVKLLIDDGRICSFENLVEEAYAVFPKKFSVQKHPEWPDTLVIDRSVRRCATSKKWIAGKSATGFKLMPAGETIAADTIKRLQGKKPLVKSLPQGGRQTQSGRVVKHIETSTAFVKFHRTADYSTVTEFELAELLYCTVESTPDTFENNLAVLVSNVLDFRRDDLLPFLTGLRRHFTAKFVESAKMEALITP
jgi:hypothetical protein